jgi:cytochrome c oxidase subunit I
MYHWFPKMSGRMLNEKLGKLHFVLNYIGFFLTFFPMHFLGLSGMPRRIWTYDERFTSLNVLATIGALILGFSVIPFFINMFMSLANGKPAGRNPWRALTLEWMTSSPPAEHNFDGVPIPASDPYGYGTPEAAAYLASEGKISLPSADHGHGHEQEKPVAGD